MEFEELQKIWDSQNNQHLYAIDGKALHQRILAKQRSGLHITNVSELLLIVVNLASAIFILSVNFFKPGGNISMQLLVAWMVATSLLVLFRRIRRIAAEKQFNRTMHGDLNYAISVASYQVRLSQLMHWNIVPIAVLVVLGMLEAEKPFWVAGVVVAFFAIAWFAGNWEHGIYKNKKRELELLKKKLEGEPAQL